MGRGLTLARELAAALANLAPGHRTALVGEEDEGADDDPEPAARARR